MNTHLSSYFFRLKLPFSGNLMITTPFSLSPFDTCAYIVVVPRGLTTILKTTAPNKNAAAAVAATAIAVAAAVKGDSSS